MGLWIKFGTSSLSVIFHSGDWIRNGKGGSSPGICTAWPAPHPHRSSHQSPPQTRAPEALIDTQSLVWLPALLHWLISLLWLEIQYPLQKVCNGALKLFASTLRNVFSSSSKLSAFMVSIPPISRAAGFYRNHTGPQYLVTSRNQCINNWQHRKSLHGQ